MKLRFVGTAATAAYLAIVMFWLAFWGTALYIIVHFIRKIW